MMAKRHAEGTRHSAAVGLAILVLAYASLKVDLKPNS